MHFIISHNSIICGTLGLNRTPYCFSDSLDLLAKDPTPFTTVGQ